MCNFRNRYPSRPKAIAERRHAHVPVLAVLLFAICGSLAHAGDLYITCSAGVSLAMADVRDVFLGEKQFAGPVKLFPVDNSTAQSEFLERLLKMDSSKYMTTWTKKSFRDGATPPSTKSGDVEVIEYLKHTPGGCGYLSSAPPAGLTLIGKI